MKYSIVHLEDRLGNLRKRNILIINIDFNITAHLHHSRLEGEDYVGVIWSQLDLHQSPDAVGQLHGLVDHVLTL